MNAQDLLGALMKAAVVTYEDGDLFTTTAPLRIGRTGSTDTVAAGRAYLDAGGNFVIEAADPCAAGHEWSPWVAVSESPFTGGQLLQFRHCRRCHASEDHNIDSARADELHREMIARLDNDAS